MNAINWFEIPAANFERACHFYEQIFAVQLRQDASFPGIQMAVFPYGENGVGGAVVKMEQMRPHQDGLRVYLNGGEDLDVVLTRVEAAGGQVVLPKMLISEHIGYIGLFADSEGNVVGLHSQH